MAPPPLSPRFSIIPHIRSRTTTGDPVSSAARSRELGLRAMLMLMLLLLVLTVFWNAMNYEHLLWSGHFLDRWSAKMMRFTLKKKAAGPAAGKAGETWDEDVDDLLSDDHGNWVPLSETGLLRRGSKNGGGKSIMEHEGPALGGAGPAPKYRGDDPPDEDEDHSPGEDHPRNWVTKGSSDFQRQMHLPRKLEWNQKMMSDLAENLALADKIIAPFQIVHMGDTEEAYITGTGMQNDYELSTHEKCLIEGMRRVVRLNEFEDVPRAPTHSGKRREDSGTGDDNFLGANSPWRRVPKDERLRRTGRVYIGWRMHGVTQLGRGLIQSVIEERREKTGYAANELLDLGEVDHRSGLWTRHVLGDSAKGGGGAKTPPTPLLDQIFTDEVFIAHLDGRGDKMRLAINDRQRPIALVGPDWMRDWRPCGWFPHISEQPGKWTFIQGPTVRQSGFCSWQTQVRVAREMVKVSTEKFPNESVIFLMAAGPFGKFLANDIFLWSDVGKKDVVIDVGSSLDAMAGRKGTRSYNVDPKKNCKQFFEAMPCESCKKDCAKKDEECPGCKCRAGSGGS